MGQSGPGGLGGPGGFGPPKKQGDADKDKKKKDKWVPPKPTRVGRKKKIIRDPRLHTSYPKLPQ